MNKQLWMLLALALCVGAMDAAPAKTQKKGKGKVTARKGKATRKGKKGAKKVLNPLDQIRVDALAIKDANGRAIVAAVGVLRAGIKPDKVNEIIAKATILKKHKNKNIQKKAASILSQIKKWEADEIARVGKLTAAAPLATVAAAPAEVELAGPEAAVMAKAEMAAEAPKLQQAKDSARDAIYEMINETADKRIQAKITSLSMDVKDAESIESVDKLLNQARDLFNKAKADAEAKAAVARRGAEQTRLAAMEEAGMVEQGAPEETALVPYKPESVALVPVTTVTPAPEEVEMKEILPPVTTEKISQTVEEPAPRTEGLLTVAEAAQARQETPEAPAKLAGTTEPLSGLPTAVETI